MPSTPVGVVVAQVIKNGSELPATNVMLHTTPLTNAKVLALQIITEKIATPIVSLTDPLPRIVRSVQKCEHPVENATFVMGTEPALAMACVNVMRDISPPELVSNAV